METLSFYYGFLSQFSSDFTLHHAHQSHRNRIIQKRLERIISFAKRNTEFYKKLYHGVSPNTPIDQYPIISKKDMVDHFDKMVIDNRINQLSLKKYFSKPFDFDRRFLNKYLAFHTSGSSGNPAYVIWNNRDFGYSTANYFIKVRRFFFPHLSLRKLRALRVAYIGITDDYVGGNSWAAGLKRLCDLKIFSIFQKIESLVVELNEFGPNLIMTKPSLLGELARLQGMGQLRIRPQHVVFAGEMINPVDSQAIKDNFGISVSNSYSTCESGPIAFQSDNGIQSLEVFENMVKLELVDEENRSIRETGVYGDIVITNLYNTTMPVIRYRIGDRACFLPSESKNLSISYIQGRNTSFFEFELKDRKLKVPEYLFWSLYVAGVQRYQVKQISVSSLKVYIEYEKGLTESSKSLVQDRVFCKIKRIFDASLRALIEVEFEERSKIKPNKAGKIHITFPMTFQN